MSPSLFRACESPVDLMALAGVEAPSPAIAVVLRAMYGQKLGAEELAIWRTVSSASPPDKASRRTACCIGRRGLKTSGILSWCAVFEALCVAHEDHALKGSRVYFVVVAPRQSQSREAVRGVRAALDALAPVGVRYSLRDASGAPEIVIDEPASTVEKVVTILSADSVAVRGFAIAFAAIDEAGFLSSEEWHAETDASIVRALAAGQVQFPESKFLMTSSPGAPRGVFHSWVEGGRVRRFFGGRPLVVRAPSWVVNPRVTQEQCRAIAGDEVTFEQEFAVRRFGYNSESFVASAAVMACLGSPAAGKGPRSGLACVVGLDVGQVQDDTGICAVSTFERDVSEATAPVRHVVVEHVEAIKSDRRSPPSLESIVARAASISDAFGRAPILFDVFAGPTIKMLLNQRGYREVREANLAQDLRPGTFCQMSVSAQAQTPKWKLLAELCGGRRLHLGSGAEDEALAREICELKATTLSSGALKVDGKKDNRTDAFNLAVAAAMLLPPSDGGDGVVAYEGGSFHFDHDTRAVREVGGRWVRKFPDGRVELAEVPLWHWSFVDYAIRNVLAGTYTPNTTRWLRRELGRVASDAEAREFVASLEPRMDADTRAVFVGVTGGETAIERAMRTARQR